MNRQPYSRAAMHGVSSLVIALGVATQIAPAVLAQPNSIPIPRPAIREEPAAPALPAPAPAQAVTVAARPVAQLGTSERANLVEAFTAMRRGDWTRARFSADQSGNAVAKAIVEWRFVLDEGAGASFEAIDAFRAEHPNWPRNEALLIRAERAMSPEMDPQQVIAWYGARVPASATGLIRLGEALIATGKRPEGADLIRKAWIQGNFALSDETLVLSTHGTIFSDADQRARLDFLLARGDTMAARRQIPRVDGEAQRIAEARMRLAASPAALRNVIQTLPENLREHPEILFEEARAFRLRGEDEEAWAIMQKAPMAKADIVLPERWWAERHIMTRDALKVGRFDVAYNLVSQHAMESGGGFADAEFLSGWIALRFQNKPEAAAGHFKLLAEGVSLPISKARGLYWLGRAEEAMARSADAVAAYRKAAEYPETYYGQLAVARINDAPVLRLRSGMSVTAPEARNAFEADERVQAIRLLADLDDKDTARLFATRIAAGSNDAKRLQLLAELMQSLGDSAMSVRVAKLASYNGVLLTPYLDPLVALPSLPGTVAAPESALVLGLTRQESEFDSGAVSTAGARGLMQLMPATARRAASTLRMPYRARDLTEQPKYNMQLGMATLSDYLGQWSGSYILGIATYNAGPGNVVRWVEIYGDPRDPNIDPIDWVELIPFGETRNYVQRVLENAGVYRNLLAGRDQPLSILTDLHRPNAAKATVVKYVPPTPTEAPRPAAGLP